MIALEEDQPEEEDAPAIPLLAIPELPPLELPPPPLLPPDDDEPALHVTLLPAES